MQNHPVILFDGVCNFCNGTVNFVIRRDKNDLFRFAALQSEAGQNLLKNHALPQRDFESVILIENGKVYQKSSALIKIFQKFRWWKWVRVFGLIPRSIRDGLYQLFARNRYRLFGKKEECMVPTPAVKAKFLL